VQEHDLIANAAARGRTLAEGLERLRSNRIVGDVRGKGLMWGVEFVRDRATRAPFERAVRVAERVGEAAFERDLIVYPGSGNVDGVRGDQILIGPPLIITDAEIGVLLERLTAAMAAVERDLERSGDLA
jgi:adenosylmethionine-8-amino-7-oxononanoate aminotransferase